MLKVVNDAVYWLLSSGTLAAVVAFLWKYLKPLLEQKAQHASTAQSKEAWGLLEAVARTAVDSLVSNNNLSGKEKHKVATAQVLQTMSDNGVSVDHTTAANAVQAAYEVSPLTPTVDPQDNHAFDKAALREGTHDYSDRLVPADQKQLKSADLSVSNRANDPNGEVKEGLQ